MIAEDNSKMSGKSKLEIYLEILNILDHRDALKLAQIINVTNLDFNGLRENIGFLINQGLIEVKIIHQKRKIYSITPLGSKVLNQFRALKETIQIINQENIIVRNQEQYLSN